MTPGRHANRRPDSRRLEHYPDPPTGLRLEVHGRIRTALLTALVCAACGADAGPVARVGEWSLSRQRLADLLVLAQPLPLETGTVTGIVEHWIGMAALAQHAAAGTDLSGADALDASLWLERREARLDAYRRTLLAPDPAVTPEDARSDFEADSLRLIAHVLRRVGAFTSPEERELQLRTARNILDGLLQGGSWADAVARSEDDETRDASGLLGLVRIDELPPALRPAAAILEPGQVSAVVESPQGFHILYRPVFDDVAELYASLLSDRRLEEADVRELRRLRDSLELEIGASRVDSVRALARGSALADEAAEIATWNGGALSADVAGRYVLGLPEDDRARMADAPDEAVARFIEQLAVRQARLDIARAEGIEPDSATLAGLEAMHRTDVEEWLAVLSGDGASPTREALERYMERLVSRQTALRPIPPLFRNWLLEPLDWGHDRSAQEEAMALARRLLAAASEVGGR